MNKTASFFLAPVTSIFSPSVYQDAVKSSVGRGVLYVLYWSFLTAVIATAVVASQFLPQSDKFMTWAEKEMPVIIWTPDGASLESGQDTATLTHPTYGPIAIFDMKKTEVKEADMGQAYLFMTATKVFIRRGPNSFEERDITQAGIQSKQQLPPKIRITGELVGKFYQTMKKALMFFIPIMVFAGIFLVFLIGNLLYSLAGLLFNAMRKNKLRYGAIFNLTCFATGVSLTLMWIKAVSPFRAMPWPFWVSLLINLAYMFFAFKVTDGDSAKEKV
jgi:hypothetical protein